MVRYHRVIAFASRVILGQYPVGGYYLGKTSDLVFRTEPDKSIDLDDGTTEVGSEKLSFSCSLLGKLNNQADIREIWLIPVVNDYLVQQPEIVRIYVEDGDYKLETKSGEFEKTLFSATLRYPVGSSQYDSLAYWQTSGLHIVAGQLEGDIDGALISVEDELETLCTLDCNDLILRGGYAFVNLSGNHEHTLSCGGSVFWGDYLYALGGFGIVNGTI
ncbi:hypothetical protein MASR1M36_08950 [Candidatus Cloacimonadaceae bacterium]